MKAAMAFMIFKFYPRRLPVYVYVCIYVYIYRDGAASGKAGVVLINKVGNYSVIGMS